MKLLLAVVLVMHTACSAFGPRKQTLHIDSSPHGASVSINAAEMGRTPVSIEVRRNQDLLIEVSKLGYESEFLKPRPRMPSTLGILDMIGGVAFLFPFLGLLSDAANVNAGSNLKTARSLAQPGACAPESSDRMKRR
jgi:hypothetical protein